MIKDKDMAAINEQMANYRRAVEDRRFAEFDVTLIEALNITVGFTRENPEGTLLTFDQLRGMPEERRNAFLRFVQNSHGVNFFMPDGVTWESGIPESRNIFDANLRD